MIVYCEKCKSKFKVDDARIPEAGVMASCSVCSHRFHLMKEPEIVELATESVVEQTDKAAAATPEPSPAVTWDFSGFADGDDDALYADDSVSVPASTDFEIVTEIADPDNSPEITAGFARIDDFNDVFSHDPVDTMTNPAYKAFEAFLERQSASGLSSEDGGFTKGAIAPEPPVAANAQTPAAVKEKLAGSVAAERESLASFRSERIQAEVKGDSTADSAAPAIVADGRHSSLQCGMKKSPPEIVSLLDERGLTDEYVVTKVQEVCEATRYVEGVEKPDWQTRILGLDMLCKIRGLYQQEKKDEPVNRQLQIVTGINM